jgi:acetyl-CoA carboxylase carboxyl transferase subunit alpha
VSTYLDFEKPIAQIAQRATDYRAAGDDAGGQGEHHKFLIRVGV